MPDPIIYRLDFGLANLVLTLTHDRFTSKGPMQNLDIPLGALRHYCLAPVPNDAGTYDSQLVLTWDEGGQRKSKKINVRAIDSTFKTLLNQLGVSRPDANLLHLDPAEAQKQMGVLSTSKLAWMIVLGALAVLGAAIGILAALQ